MNMERLFGLTGVLVMPFWLLMIFAPRTRVTAWAMRFPVGPVLPALMYLALVAPRMGAIFPALMQPKLGEISALLGTPEGATIGWLHFLALDLFVGRWIYLDAKERGISAWVISPLLFLTLMFGPIGMLAYLGIRSAAARRGLDTPAVQGVAP
ncbi:MAG TPA: ABA4-like family protein [Myxococcaceae bacterium]|nr:ABA4-like family protein [Myxococcaceae bacterium]